MKFFYILFLLSIPLGLLAQKPKRQMNFSIKEVSKWNVYFEVGEISIEGKNTFASINKRDNLFQLKNDFSLGEQILSKGDSPFEISHLRNFNVYKDKIFCVDDKQNLLKSYSLSGNLLESFKLKSGIADGAPVAPNLFVVYSYTTEKKKSSINVKVVNIKEQTILNSYSLAEYLKPVQAPELVYDGDFYYSEEGNITAYLCYYSGDFFYFNSRGDMVNHFTTIHKYYKPLPQITTFKNKDDFLVTTFKGDQNFYQLSATFFGSYFIILSNIAESRLHPLRVLDFYSKLNGQYKGSVEIPNHNGEYPVMIRALDDNVLVFYDNGSIISYTISKE